MHGRGLGKIKLICRTAGGPRGRENHPYQQAEAGPCLHASLLGRSRVGILIPPPGSLKNAEDMRRHLLRVVQGQCRCVNLNAPQRTDERATVVYSPSSIRDRYIYIYTAWSLYLEEYHVRIVLDDEVADRLHPPVHRDMLVGPDVVRHQLHLTITPHSRVLEGE